MFERALARIGLVPATELATAVSERIEALKALKHMTTARDELAHRLGDARHELADLDADVAAAQASSANLQHELGRTVWELQQLKEEHDALDRRVAQLQAENAELTQRADEANAFIAQLQRQRPQMRLMRPDSETRGVDDEAPAEDEIIVPEHTVEMTARVIVISLEGKTHWTLSVNDHLFKVALHDRKFLDDPTHTFARGSVVRAEFRETTFRRGGDGEPYTTRSLERVLEVIPPPPTTTQPMFAEGPEAAAERS
jgi:hypothetical protein